MQEIIEYHFFIDHTMVIYWKFKDSIEIVYRCDKLLIRYRV